MDAIFFNNAAELRQWFHENHNKATEIWVGYYKKNSGKANFSWSESVDEALCYGWIDGIRKSIDEERYRIRFTPRKPNSIWSAVNLKKMEVLIANGLMQAAGLAAYEKKKKDKSKVYSFEQKEVSLSPTYEALIKANEEAWGYFQQLSPYYKKASIWYVMSAKRETTRQKRIQLLIECSAKGEKLPQFMKYKKKS
ncbi:MAG: YdeI/OmpD-associated family protein [Flammeovirgaceae bacterium]